MRYTPFHSSAFTGRLRPPVRGGHRRQAQAQGLFAGSDVVRVDRAAVPADRVSGRAGYATADAASTERHGMTGLVSQAVPNTHPAALSRPPNPMRVE